MIENIKQFVNEHRTLIVVIISVLVICFLYWWFFCKDISSVKGGYSNHTTTTFLHEDKKFACRCIGADCKDIGYGGKVYHLIVLNDKGMEKMRELLPKVDDFYSTYLHSFFIRPSARGEKDINKNIYEIIADPIKKINPELSKIGLSYFGNDDTIFDFSNILQPISNINGVNYRNTIFGYYASLIDDVVNKIPSYFDKISYVGQLGKYTLPTTEANTTDLEYSGPKKNLIDTVFSIALFRTFINDAENIRSWYKTERVGRDLIKNFYFNERNGCIIKQYDGDDDEFFGKIYDVLQQITEIYLLKVDNISFGKNIIEISNELMQKKNEMQRRNDELLLRRVSGREEDKIKEKSKIINELDTIVDNTKIDIAKMRTANLDQRLYELDVLKERYNIKLDKRKNKKVEIITNALKKNPKDQVKYVNMKEVNKRDMNNAKQHTADIYPAYKMALTIFFLILVYPNFCGAESNPENFFGNTDDYLNKIASYILFVNSFNIFCNVKMDGSWNESIGNEFVYKKINGQQSEGDMNLNLEILATIESQIMCNHVTYLDKKYPGLDMLGKMQEKLAVCLFEGTDLYYLKQLYMLNEKVDDFDELGNAGEIALGVKLGKFHNIVEDKKQDEFKRSAYMYLYKYVSYLLTKYSSNFGKSLKPHPLQDLLTCNQQQEPSSLQQEPSSLQQEPYISPQHEENSTLEDTQQIQEEEDDDIPEKFVNVLNSRLEEIPESVNCKELEYRKEKNDDLKVELLELLKRGLTTDMFSETYKEFMAQSNNNNNNDNDDDS